MMGIVIAGTHSGVGKTTVGMCIAAALKKRGYRVQPFKVGPDFIDPTHYSFCDWAVNLDVFMMGENGVKRSFCKWMQNKDFALIEGVMGLFDGYKFTSYSSTAHISKILKIPVVLVVDARGIAYSVLAMFEGYKNFDREVNVAGIVINRGTKYHEKLKRLFQDRGYRFLGVLPKSEELEIGSRHLGLKLGYEINKDWRRLAEYCEAHIDIDAIIELAEVELECSERSEEIVDSERKIGIPLDEAFAFYYRDNLDKLKNFGKLEFFSALKGEFVECDMYYIGGGYPELYELSKFSKFIKKEATSGKPIYAECGGFMSLCRGIEIEGKKKKMAGVLDIDIIFTKKLQALGYVEGRVVRENPFFVGRFRGHEFHYSYAIPDPDVKFAFEVSGKGIVNGKDGAYAYKVLAGYSHIHFYSSKFKWEL